MGSRHRHLAATSKRSRARALVTLMPQVQVSVSGGVVTGPWSHDERKKELPCARRRAHSI